ncbi:MAG: 3-dehydroquinate synthase [Candidatus Schekmanbacteria bacterium]|nr:3-dehydroquinate synthase [Candidatus Schekmanbacteria bacterium]
MCGPAGAQELRERLERHLGKPRDLAIVTDENVAALYLDPMRERLRQAGWRCEGLVVPAGEESKSLAVVERLYGRLISMDMDRGGAVLALGGGVVGDLAGFVAATYLRGIDFIQMPTSLLAQVDASIGGKVGINHAAGKNLIGAFHQPRLVLVDVAYLRTLPRKEITCGLAEVLKYAVLAGEPLFGWLESRIEELAGDAVDTPFRGADWVQTVASCAAIKAQVVADDEREADKRMLLNLGHTFGHGLEQAGGFRDFSHGEAVGWGTAVATDVAVRLGLLSTAEGARIERLFARAGLPTSVRGYSVEAVMEAMRSDKKRSSGRLRFVLPRAIGDVAVVSDVPGADIAAALRCRLGDESR